ncbi:aldehyde dehydrogenase family protein [Streptomyces sp. NBC_01387]|uniref:aldehyde dehydrogenase family protein n=1 Tax=unclassified Streptomyces TaxID=2593676 RepID=UPI0020249644|nr:MULTISPECIES: aldehyde dehydrogenase family protein [unclassified Streptomyces]MCX4550269.1 aldehyde dehydrogenase family protein [Streptomyces sp. NBC_01500]WSC21764.1 aldehyde dehydrogenase family protein [Streptomyces sp. NBC_01766]WSV55722.1 aldehyde dehydrogenase family protein [Streptomyces sp. NBC_01014]
MSAEQGLFIDGEWVAPDRGHYDVINPATEESVGPAPEASREQVYAAAAAARAAFAGWSRTKPEERAAILDRAAGIMQREFLPYAELAQAESGATTGTARGMQVGVGVSRFRRYAKGALEPVETGLPPQINEAGPMGKAGVFGALAVRQPVGVVTCITSYNNPWANPAGKIAPALAMGNTVVVKPAPQDPLSVYRMAEALAEAGVPRGVVNVVSGTRTEVGEAAVDSPDVDMVSFTGSTGVGRSIAEVCGRGMKRQLMELGGKGAAVVFDDADLDSAVAGIGTTFAFYSGQICTAPTRVLAQRGIYDQLVTQLTAYMGYLKVGDPTVRGTVVGPVISAAHRDRIESYVELGRKEGATVVAGGERPAFDKGFYVTPTLLADCTNDMRVVREEIFGPVVVVVPFDDEDEGIALANDSEYGLLDYVWSGDVAKAFRVARQLRAGGVGVNTIGRNMEAPFGGFKQSGVGRDVGSYALHAYSETQSIVWPG